MYIYIYIQIYINILKSECFIGKRLFKKKREQECWHKQNHEREATRPIPHCKTIRERLFHISPVTNHQSKNYKRMSWTPPSSRSPSTTHPLTVQNLLSDLPPHGLPSFFSSVNTRREPTASLLRQTNKRVNAMRDMFCTTCVNLETRQHTATDTHTHMHRDTREREAFAHHTPTQAGAYASLKPPGPNMCFFLCIKKHHKNLHNKQEQLSIWLINYKNRIVYVCGWLVRTV